MPKVSVIIPTYNCSSWLLEAIDSVLNQTFKGYELIIVDDGSTDDTQSKVETIKDERLCYFYKENAGAASARNVGLQKATGQYIAFLDADDLWPESYLEIMVSTMDKATDYGVAYGTVTQHYPDGTERKQYRMEDFASGWIMRRLFYRGFIFVQASIWRKSVLGDFRFDESLKTSEAYDAFLRLSLRTKFLVVSGVEVIRRVREGALTFVPPVNCERLLLKERFYFTLGGKEHIPEKEAWRHLSRTYKHIAKRYYNQGAKRASVYLFKKALSYTPFNLEIMLRLLQSFLLINDSDPNWRFPEPLPLINYKQA